jgi:hypothetical protein
MEKYDWRDPDMKVVGFFKDPAGNEVVASPDAVQSHCQMMMIVNEISYPHNVLLPNWRNDPTYNMRRKVI